MGNWFGAHYIQEVRFNLAVKCKKGPQVLTSLLNQRRNYCYYYFQNQIQKNNQDRVVITISLWSVDGLNSP